MSSGGDTDPHRDDADLTSAEAVKLGHILFKALPTDSHADSTALARLIIEQHASGTLNLAPLLKRVSADLRALDQHNEQTNVTKGDGGTDGIHHDTGR